ncbi:MAG: hemerythrin domain-containing protein [Solirubrobacteraceae bacterium]
MKRHPAIAALSRDHHHALVVAQRLRRATDDDGSAARAREKFLEYWRADGAQHFREEEEILLPTFAGFGDVEAPVVARVLVDHVRIRRLADELAASETPPLTMLHDLGQRLADHVRLEERELFDLIERALPEDELVRLADVLT